MSESRAEPTSEVSNDHVDGGATTGAAVELHVDSPKLVPEQGDGARAEPPKRDMPRLGAPGHITIMAPSRDSASRDGESRDGASRERSWEDFVNAEPRPEPAQKSGSGRVLAIAAMIALAVTTGAVGGSMATSGLGKLFAVDDSTGSMTSPSLEERVARLDGEVTALKTEVDRNARLSASARAKSADRLDKLEKAQAEPAAKLAKLSETVEKLRSAQASQNSQAAVPVAAAAARDVTGSIAAPTPTPAPKPELGRLPVVEGWRLIDVAGGGATIEGRPGVFEVYAGDPVPGLGRIDAIRKQDGRWTVITSRGLIVGR